MSHAITVETIDNDTAEVLFIKDDEHTLALVEFGVADDGEVTITSATVLLFGEGVDVLKQISSEVEGDICDAIAVAYIEHREQSEDYL